jgi:UDP-3-O-[3-hydroxymyristoyl] glucosamine N-acyltransferase
MELKVRDITSMLPVTQVVGNTERFIRKVVSATGGTADAESVLWISDKNLALIKVIHQGCIICSNAAPQSDFNAQCTYLVVPNPRQYFASLVKMFFIEDEKPFISEKATLDANVNLGKNVTIRAGAVIEKNCVIGDYSSIDSNTVLKRGTIVGNRVKIGANNTIGGEGFGYEKDDSGQYGFIPHIGNVVIEDDVEIGNNTTIDRAVLGSTFIRKNAKIDNLVHIAHGVEIGENSLIIANSMVAGSTTIGQNVWVAPSASIINKISVGDNAVIGMGAVVVRSVAEGVTIVGNPGKDITTLKKPS